MPRTVPLLAGVVIISAVTYKFRDDLLKDTNELQQRLQAARKTLDNVTSSTSTKSLIDTPHQSILPPFTLIDDSKNYVTNRLVPSVKHSWNSQVTQVAHNLVNTDYSGKAKQAWEKIKENIQ
ncbi:uncharacterized protein BX664DRAFT_322498 [Halteromyces radiatus]|uniref:uncharacterized protein n=1 Tax=Halteromyces radiatus TaxID=101107 RepID=UPI00221E9F26|nr:uncharacterized protein BX664DRAFT_322498 [Halteromyces radiatus]KAI8099954.1 hypothetical protein BX664DRAFT_322498 [Halteromyces radiatus]